MKRIVRVSEEMNLWGWSLVGLGGVWSVHLFTFLMSSWAFSGGIPFMSAQYGGGSLLFRFVSGLGVAIVGSLDSPRVALMRSQILVTSSLSSIFPP